METPDLSDPAYWEDEGIDVRQNPARRAEADGLADFVRSELGIRSATVLATSGSTGVAKFVLLRREALLASARAVAERCGIVRGDVAYCQLPDFHVGGLAMHARAHLTGSRVAKGNPRDWRREGRSFLAGVEAAGATLASLTPTHLHDLVRVGARAPIRLRGLLLGGGPIEPGLVALARELGWPVWATYGMTETSSQVATSVGKEVEWLPLLEKVEARADAAGRLSLRGPMLFAGYVRGCPGAWSFEPGLDAEGWFLSGDRAALRRGDAETRGRAGVLGGPGEIGTNRGAHAFGGGGEGCAAGPEGLLRFLGRADSLVKVSGEWVSPDRLDRHREALGIPGAVIAMPDPRRGHRIVLVLDGAGVGEGKESSDAEDRLERFNSGLPGIERASACERVAELPRTPAGKVDLAALRRHLAGRG